MPASKIAISLPEEILADVDRAAHERGKSRSGYIRRLLRAATRARRDAEITRRLDALFADEAVATEQPSNMSGMLYSAASVIPL